MKKIILSSLLFIGAAFVGTAQDNIGIKVTATGIGGNTVPTGDDTDYSSGHAPFIYNTNASGTIDFYIDVENNTSTAKDWRISRFNEPDVSSSWTNMVCVGVCFPASTMNPYCTPNSANGILSLAAGANGEISYHVTINNGGYGTGTYKLYLGDCTTFEDSIELQINYTVGVKELNQTPSFSMYPNPANDLVSIQLNNSKNGTVKIVDLVGNVVYSETISSSKTLNTSEFKNGIYFVTIESEGQRMTSRKLVVKH